MVSKFDVKKYKRGEKIWVHMVGEPKIPAMFVQYADGGAVIVKEVGKLNKQGYSLTKPFGINITLIEPRTVSISLQRRKNNSSFWMEIIKDE